MKTHVHGVIELTLQSARDYTNPLWDSELRAEFTSPSGRQYSIRGFWDGGRTWRIRFSPDETGRWTCRTQCSAGDDTGLADQAYDFDCVAYDGENPVYRHGPLMVAPTQRTLQHRDGTPFFWLGDTAWNGVIRGDDDNWRRYLETRVRQRFTVIQYVSSHWRGDAVDEAGEPACTEEHPITINPGYFQRLDARVAMINAHGLIAAPVALWSLLKSDIGYKLPAEDAIRLATYIVARYDACQVAWILGGDGNYQEMGVERWRRIGRAVFNSGHNRLVTLHPCGQNWVGEEFRTEPWYDFIGYQSGHGDGDDHLRWLTSGPPAHDWDNQPHMPAINLEPNYETALGYQHGTAFTDYHVRRAAYWSLLVSPTAGLTYGHDAIWNWNFASGPSEGHGNWHNGAVPPWHTGLETPGIDSMTAMRAFFEGLDWTTLVPYQSCLGRQPGHDDVKRFIAAARSADGTVVIYAPCGGAIHIAAGVDVPLPVRIVDPRTGDCAGTIERVQGGTIVLPDEQDWLVVCGQK